MEFWQALCCLFAASLVHHGEATNHYECGTLGSASASVRIVNGETVDSPDALPWTALIWNDGSFYQGVLISDQYVLTSAGNVNWDLDPNNYFVEFGIANYINDYNTFTYQGYGVIDITVHEGYDSEIDINDIALLRLEQPVRVTNDVMPICLPSQGQDFSFSSTCIMSGFGQTDHFGQTQYSTDLQKAVTNVVSDYDCANDDQIGQYPFIPNQYICAGGVNGDPGICRYDQGTPLACQDSGRWTLAGVGNWYMNGGYYYYYYYNGYRYFNYVEEECTAYSVYTQVSTFVNWINTNTVLDSTTIPYRSTTTAYVSRTTTDENAYVSSTTTDGNAYVSSTTTDGNAYVSSTTTDGNAYVSSTTTDGNAYVSSTTTDGNAYVSSTTTDGNAYVSSTTTDGNAYASTSDATTARNDHTSSSTTTTASSSATTTASSSGTTTARNEHASSIGTTTAGSSGTTTARNDHASSSGTTTASSSGTTTASSSATTTARNDHASSSGTTTASSSATTTARNGHASSSATTTASSSATTTARNGHASSSATTTASSSGTTTDANVSHRQTDGSITPGPTHGQPTSGSPINEGSTEAPNNLGNCGVVTHPNSIPWIAKIYRNLQDSGSYASLCTAVLGHLQWLVTTADCFAATQDVRNYTVVLGHSNATRQTRAVSVLHVHPNYTSNNIVNNIAIIQLVTAATATADVQAICLPFPSEVVPVTARCYMVGLSQSGERPERFQQDIYNDFDCDRIVGDANYVSDRQICSRDTYSRPNGTCNRNIGAPLLCIINGENRWILIGAMIWGERDGCSGPARFTTISYHIRWLASLAGDLPILTSAGFANLSDLGGGGCSALIANTYVVMLMAAAFIVQLIL